MFPNLVIIDQLWATIAVCVTGEKSPGIEVHTIAVEITLRGGEGERGRGGEGERWMLV